MNPAKKFDAVKMKQEAQARLAKETAGLTVEQRRERFEASIADDPQLRKLWRKKPRSRAN